MIDTLELSIPFDASLVSTREDGSYAFVDVSLDEMDIKLGAKSVYWTEDKELKTSHLYHPYESLPTSFTGMACKVHFDGYFYPHVTIKCSVAKIMQGHNVFGSDNLENAVIEMLYWLRESYASLYSMLAIQCTEVVRIDITYMSKVSNEKVVRQAIDFLSHVHNGQTRATKNKKYETTAYWGGATSRLIRQKCYGKYEEFQSQLNEYLKLANSGDTHALAIVKAMSDQRVQDFARNSLRWECTFLKRWLQRNDLPVNVFELIQRQRQQSDVFKQMWYKGFSKIFEAVRGLEMRIVTDDQVLNKLKSVFFTINSKGKVSYRKANNLYDFYRSLKLDGYIQVKTSGRYSISRFNELIADLCTAGFSKAYLQNLDGEKDQAEIIPFMNIIHVDFSQQLPSWYEEPIPTPIKLLSA